MRVVKAKHMRGEFIFPLDSCVWSEDGTRLYYQFNIINPLTDPVYGWIDGKGKFIEGVPYGEDSYDVDSDIRFIRFFPDTENWLISVNGPGFNPQAEFHVKSRQVLLELIKQQGSEGLILVPKLDPNGRMW